MSILSCLARLSLPVALLLAAAGCGHDDPALAPVHGRVFYKGVPLPGGSIVFTPDADKGGRGPIARGEIRPDGTYTLTTDGQPGATPGWHRVTVVSVEAAPGKPAGTGLTDVRSLLPRQYAAPDLSGLDRLVKPGQENVIDFHLD
jgi:hypothetical protein